ncbi:hypothetical protein ACFL27_22590, partial [candidate division CSSED10-310 bacterium]
LYDGTTRANPKFGTGGKTETIGGGASWMEIDGNGKIWGVGKSGGEFVLARVDSTGAIDTTFGTATGGTDPAGKIKIAGTASDALDHAVGLVIEPGNTAVLVGRTTTDLSLVRVKVNGVIHESISQAGTGDGTFSTIFDVQALARNETNGDLFAAGNHNGNIILLKMAADGFLDCTWEPIIAFGTNDFGTTGFDYCGYTELDLTEDVIIHSVDIDATGRILVAGEYNATSSFTGFGSLLVRFNPDGTPDTTFGGGDGVVILHASPTPDYVNSFMDVKVLPSGDILACGIAANDLPEDYFGQYKYYYWTLAKFDSIGDLVPTFGTNDFNGKIFDGSTFDGIDGLSSLVVDIIPMDSANGNSHPYQILVDDQSRIILVGWGGDSHYYWKAARFDVSGDLDQTFGASDGDGTDGVAVFSPSLLNGVPGTAQDLAYDAVMQLDGKIVLSGTATNWNAAIARLDQNGIMDTTFGPSGTGYTITDFGMTGFPDIALEPGGKFVVTGNDFKIARFKLGGNLNVSFGTNGLMDITGTNDLTDVLILPGWKMLVSGEEGGVIARLQNTDNGDPEIDIQRPAETSIPDGETDDIGAKPLETVHLTYTIDNTAGEDYLFVTGVTASGLTNVSNFSLNTTMPFTVTFGKKATFEISFDVVAEGSFSFDMDIANDDPDESTYDIAVSGTGSTIVPTLSLAGLITLLFLTSVIMWTFRRQRSRSDSIV